MEKIYKVEFMKYANYCRDKVTNGETEIGKIEYLNVPSPFLIKEYEIESYKKWGGGYKSLEFVGYLNI